MSRVVGGTAPFSPASSLFLNILGNLGNEIWGPEGLIVSNQAQSLHLNCLLNAASSEPEKWDPHMVGGERQKGSKLDTIWTTRSQSLHPMQGRGT